MAGKRWSKEDIDYLKNNYSKVPTVEISKKLNRTIKSINKQTNRLGIKFEKPKNKTCCSCGELMPRTKEFFFIKKCKQKLKTGENVVYSSFRSDCKRCFFLKNDKRRIQKRCKELGCSIDDYHTAWREKYSDDRTKYPELKAIPKTRRWHVSAKINKGYKFTTIEQYKKDCSLNVSLARRKYDYAIKDRCLTLKEKNAMMSKVLPDSLVCNRMGFKINEVPKDVIEMNRLLIQIKQELKK